MTAPFATETRKRLMHLLVLASLIIGSLVTIAPFAGAPVAAQPLCLDETVWSEEAQQCVPLEEAQPVAETPPTETPIPPQISSPIETPAPTAESAEEEDAQPVAETLPSEIPALTETGAATATAGDDGDLRVGEATAGLGMFANACPSGFDPLLADFDTLHGTCGVFLRDVQFSLTVAGVVFGSTVTPEGPYPAQFTNVPPGDFAVSLSFPPGYTGPAAIICYHANQSSTSQTRYTFTQDGGPFVLPDVQPGSYWYCHSYLVPITTGMIEVVAWSCPDGYDIYTKGPDELIGDCGQKLAGVEFLLQHPTAGIDHQLTAGLRSTAYFRNIPPGQVTLREGMPNGYGIPVVFCEARGPGGQTIDQYDAYNVSNSASVQLGMDALDRFRCDFFQALGGRPVVDVTLQDQGFPAQLDPATANVEAVASPASQAPPLGTPIAEQAGTDVTGLQDQGVPAQVDPAIANPDTAPGSAFITIFEWTCPGDFAASGAELGAYFDNTHNCQQVPADAGFVVGSNNDTVGATTTEASGAAVIRDVPPGDVVVAGAIPLGFGAPVVFCTTVQYPSEEIVQQAQRYAASPSGSITIPGVQAGQGVYCDWFNIPTDATGAIDVVAWSCPDGYDISTKGPDELIGDCGQKLGGVEFLLQHPTAGISTQVTAGFRSTAYFRNIAPGQVTLRESMPNGYGIPVVFCEARGPDGQTIDQYDAYNVSNSASVQLGMDALDRFRCDFFQALGGRPVVDASAPASQEDLPLSTPDDSPGAVTIVTYECPASFDAYNATANEINLTCPPVRGELVFEFSLFDGAGALQIQHTGLTDPYLEFTEVAPGAISITASVPSGFGEPVVYCQMIGVGSGAPGPYERLPLAAPDTIEHTLNASEQLACDWFNVPMGSPFDDAQSEVISE